MTQQFNIGDKVRVKQRVTPYEVGDVATVTKIDEGALHPWPIEVEHDEHPVGMFAPGELERVEEADPHAETKERYAAGTKWRVEEGAHFLMGSKPFELTSLVFGKTAEVVDTNDVKDGNLWVRVEGYGLSLVAIDSLEAIEEDFDELLGEPLRVGDRVKVLEDFGFSYAAGKKGTIERECAFGDNCLVVRLDEGGEYHVETKYLTSIVEVQVLKSKPESERKFKVGDRVKSLRPSIYAEHQGVDLAVLAITPNGNYGVGPVGNDPEKMHNVQDGWVTYLEEHLEKVEEEEKPEPEFKVGDKVKIADGATNPWGRESSGAGKTGTITFQQDEDGHFQIDVAHLVHPRDLTLIEEEPVQEFKAGDKVRVSEDATFKAGGLGVSDSSAQGKEVTVDFVYSDGDLGFTTGAVASPEFCTLIERAEETEDAEEAEDKLVLEAPSQSWTPSVRSLIELRRVGVLNREEVRGRLADMVIYPDELAELFREGLVTYDEAREYLDLA